MITTKKLKVKTYEKDVDDHFLVLVSPWDHGEKAEHMRGSWIGAWLRRALRRADERDIVLCVYVKSTRSEVIAQINPNVDINVALGAHHWIEFCDRAQLDLIRDNNKITLHNNVSYVYEYNWRRNGDPADNQWKPINPKQSPPPDSCMVKRDYPPPLRINLPGREADWILTSIVVPLPDLPLDEPMQPFQNGHHPHNEDEKKPAIADNSSSNAKIGKLDPYEQDATAHASLRADLSCVKRENGEEPGPSRVKRELEENGDDRVLGVNLHSNSDSRGSESFKRVKIEPSSGYENEDRKPIIKSEGDPEHYEPSEAVRRALSPFLSGGASRADDQAMDSFMEIGDRYRRPVMHGIKSEIKSEDTEPSPALRRALEPYLSARNSSQSASSEIQVKGEQPEQVSVKPSNHVGSSGNLSRSPMTLDMNVDEEQDRKPIIKSGNEDTGVDESTGTQYVQQHKEKMKKKPMSVW